jgi:hypothetical protein
MGVFGDFDGDGYADVSGFGYGTITRASIFRGGPLGPSNSQRIALHDPSPSNGEQFGHVAVAGDVDGDGYVDLVVGSPCYQGASCPSTANHVYLFRGGPNGIADGAAPAWTLSSPCGAQCQFGNGVAAAGDVNGDGYADVVVAENGNGASRARIFFGSPTGIATTASITIDSPSGVYGFPESMTSAGDVDGDGYGDLVLAGQNDTYFFLGSANGPSNATARALVRPAEVTSGLRVPSFGAGDINGDGLADVVVGAQSVTIDGGMKPARLYVFLGATDSTLVTYDMVLTGGDTGVINSVLADVNGDGYADVVAADSSYNGYAGHAFFLPGGASGVSDARSTPLTATFPWYGFFLASWGDVDGDGLVDVGIEENPSVGDATELLYGTLAGLSDTSRTTTLDL